jgi:hypothetical protein
MKKFVLFLIILLLISVASATSQEEYLDAYSSLVSSLLEKSNFIKNNNDNSSQVYSCSYKSNGTISTDTEFVNNELLAEVPVKIGMKVDDVYNLLGIPDTKILETNRNYIAYYNSIFVKDYYEESETGLIFASTSIGFNYDDNESVTKIILYVEEIEAPFYFYWGE